LQLPPSRHTWQLPPGNPFLRPVPKEERAGLIRGQTSAHRGLRTFAQDRSRGRRDLSALTFSQALPDDTEDGAVYLSWRLDSPPHPDLFPHMESCLLPLREHARQAGVELSFEAAGNTCLLKMIGCHEPMPAVLEEVSRCLTEFAGKPWSPLPIEPAMPIRQLLKALPAYCSDTSITATEGQTHLQNSHWLGFAAGLPSACEAAI